jgi:MYXO-CTERM domain-containing protein
MSETVVNRPSTIGSYVWLRATESDSGCSCRVVGPSERDTIFLLVVLAFGGWFWRRRRSS